MAIAGSLVVAALTPVPARAAEASQVLSLVSPDGDSAYPGRLATQAFYALERRVTAMPQLAALLEGPASGGALEALTTDPKVELYSGKFLDGALIGTPGYVYRIGDGIALEPQKFPDAPNHPTFVSACVDPASPIIMSWSIA